MDTGATVDYGGIEHTFDAVDSEEPTMGAIIRLDARHARAYVAEPVTVPRGRVLVVHDAYGLLPHVRFLCDDLAEAGFVALAPDLFAGGSTRSDAQASRFVEHLGADRADRVLRAAHAGFDVVGAPAAATGAVAFSVGADLLAASSVVTTLDGFVAYYALHSPEHSSVVRCPLLWHCAARDRSDGAGATAAIAELRRAGVDVESHVYPGTAHGFANADVGRFDLDAAEVAWRRTRQFLHRHLG